MTYVYCWATDDLSAAMTFTNVYQLVPIVHVGAGCTRGCSGKRSTTPQHIFHAMQLSDKPGAVNSMLLRMQSISYG